MEIINYKEKKPARIPSNASIIGAIGLVGLAAILFGTKISSVLGRDKIEASSMLSVPDTVHVPFNQYRSEDDLRWLYYRSGVHMNNAEIAADLEEYVRDVCMEAHPISTLYDVLDKCRNKAACVLRETLSANESVLNRQACERKKIEENGLLPENVAELAALYEVGQLQILKDRFIARDPSLTKEDEDSYTRVVYRALYPSPTQRVILNRLEIKRETDFVYAYIDSVLRVINTDSSRVNFKTDLSLLKSMAINSERALNE